MWFVESYFPDQGLNLGPLDRQGILCIFILKKFLVLFYLNPSYLLSSVQFSRSVTSSSRNPMNCSTPGLPVHHQPLEFTQTHVHRVGDAIQHFILCRSLLVLPSVFSSIRVFSNESVLRIRWPKVLEFQLQPHSFQ